jgi:nitrogen fixation protein FixH
MMARMMAGAGHRDHWIPWVFVAFFGVVLAANGAMIWIAFATWTGLETEGAYQKGLDFNRALAAARAQGALGWQVDLDLSSADGRLARLELTLADRHHSLIEDAKVTATFVRPTQAGHDLGLEVPHIHAGVYRAEAALPLAGVWDLHLAAQSGGDTYRLRRRIYLEP